GHPLRKDLEAYAQEPARAAWIDDWALFSALKVRFGPLPWMEWPAPIRRRDPDALLEVREAVEDEVSYHRYLQFLAERQWARLKQGANRRGIRVLGDIPIYPALDSADVWVHARLFDLDELGRPRHVAGVPPDLFSKTGQLWGNPLYRWELM